ncbi:MAG: sensor histidine kinase [Spirochaetota bacterium]
MALFRGTATRLRHVGAHFLRAAGDALSAARHPLRTVSRFRERTAVCPREHRRECARATALTNLARMRVVIYALFILFVYFLVVDFQMAADERHSDFRYFLYVDIFLLVLLVVHLPLSFVHRFPERRPRKDHGPRAQGGRERNRAGPGTRTAAARNRSEVTRLHMVLPQVFGGLILVWSVLVAVSEYELTGGIATYVIALLATSVLLLCRPYVTALNYGVSIATFHLADRYLGRGPDALLQEHPFLVGLLIVSFTVSRIVYRQYLSEFLARERLRDAQVKLIRQEKLASIGHLSAGIAHEINNPLGYLKSNVASLAERLKILKQDDDDGPVPTSGAASPSRSRMFEEIEEMTGDMRVAVERIQKVVRNLLDFARPHSLQEYEYYDIHEGIETTLEIARNRYKYSARIERDFGRVPRIQCRGSEINQVLLNILVNAASAVESVYSGTGRMGTITIRTRSDGNSVTCDISNNGPSIPESQREEIFEPFFTTRQSGGGREGTGREGTGLGLSIARHIVIERHHGDLRLVESGEWTTFRVELPVRQVE